MVPQASDWEPESGLADNIDAVIVGVKFEVNKRYAEVSGTQDPGMNITIKHDDGEETSQGYSIGAKKGWQIIRDGAEVVSTVDANSHRFNVSSRGGELVKRMCELIGNGSKEVGQEFFSKRGYMTQAEAYTGLKFHWDRIKLPVADKNAAPTESLMPTKYLGEVAVGGVAAPKAAAPPVAGAPVAASNLDDILITMSAGLTDRELKGAAIRNDDVKANKAYMTSVVNGSKLAELEKAGKLTKDPSTNKYV
jgi:hypothetical protein